MINDKFLTVNEVARRLNISRFTIYRLVHLGKMRHLRLGDTGTIRIPESALNTFITTNTK